MPNIYGKRYTGEWIEDSGRVVRLLSDDFEDSCHQRFIIATGSGQTLLIAHNVELGKRVPVAMGDRVRFRGIYEFNDLGGLVHWTHHDPMGIESGGWIEHQRSRYA